MTDDVAPEGEAEKVASFRIRQGPDGTDQISRYGGPWEDVTPEPVSDDPAVNAIGELSILEVQAIADDEAHPDHEAAVEYQRLFSQELREGFRALLGQTGVTTAVATALNPGAMPANLYADESEVPPALLQTARRAASKLRDQTQSIETSLATMRDPTLDVIEAQGQTNQRLQALAEVLGGMVETLQTGAEAQKNATDRSLRLAKSAAWAAWLALAVAVSAVVISLLIAE
jgi:hypothetical protein